MFNEYEEFLTKKAYKIENVGFDTDDVHPMLFPFQQAVVKWAATPDWTSKTSVLTAACRVCGLSVGDLQKRLRGGESLCAVAAGLLSRVSALPVSIERFERWQQLGDDAATDALLRNLFQESNPLRAARRSSGLSVTAFARMLGLSRQRLHVLERATGGEALLRACARAQAHSA